jgi:hypothetical protein
MTHPKLHDVSITEFREIKANEMINKSFRTLILK